MIFCITTPGGGHRMDYNQIAQTLVTAAIVAALTAWGNQQILQNEMEHVTKSIGRLEADVAQLRADLYQPVSRKDADPPKR